MSTSLIQTYMPTYRMRQVDRVRVQASPAMTWRLIRSVDLQANPLSRALFALRSLPQKLSGRSAQPLSPRTSRIDEFTGPGKGFQILAEESGKEVVIGSIGKFWKLNIEWAPMTPSTFTEFSTPGFGKLAWNLRVDPDASGGSWVTWDLRVSATDSRAWRYFRLYWFVIGKFSHGLRKLALASFSHQLGAYASEESLLLPSDELVPRPKYQKTMSTTIEAPPQEVWPWLVQMGCRRAGWYSIDRLDNGGTPSAKHLIPELQRIQVGQVLPWKPQGDDGFTVLEVQENRALVLGTASLLQGPHQPQTQFDDTWSFTLEPIGEEATRLLTRIRADYHPSWKMAIMGAWLRPVHLIMEWAQLRNLKRRIECAT